MGDIFKMLKFSRLERFILEHGYTIQRLFPLNGYILFIELLSPEQVHSIFVEIPHRYRFDASVAQNDRSMYTLRDLEIKSSEEDLGDYIYTSNVSIKSMYSNNTRTSMPVNTPLATHLSSTYRKGVVLDDIRGADAMHGRSLQRQAKRLQYCIDGTGFSVCIIHSPFIAHRDRVFKVDNAVTQPSTKLALCVDLMDFYQQVPTVEQNTSRIIHGIMSVLQDNSSNHLSDLDDILSSTGSIQQYVRRARGAKRDLLNSLESITASLRDVIRELADKRSRRDEIARKLPSGDLRMDMLNESKLSTIDREIESIDKIRKQILKQAHDTRTRHNDLALKISA